MIIEVLSEAVPETSISEQVSHLEGERWRIESEEVGQTGERRAI